jgi:hypothetical protein
VETGARIGARRPRSRLHDVARAPHALMAEIALECGYTASALKERIYALWDSARCGATGRFAILTYTATAGNQGTLGGRVATARYFGRILHAVLCRLELCSNDPICADHEPTSTADDRTLHGAACHGCLLRPAARRATCSSTGLSWSRR